MSKLLAVASGAVGVLLSMSAAAQEPFLSDQPGAVDRLWLKPTMVRIVAFPDDDSLVPGVAPAAPYPSCYRAGRCSVQDLYRFRDRPNRLARLAPEAPPDGAARPPSARYAWFLVPVTPEENIVPDHRMAGQIRDEYRAAGRPIEGPN